MASNIPLFRQLDDSMYNITCHSPYTLLYENGDEIVTLNCTPTNAACSTFTVKDDTKGNRPDDYCLHIEQTINIMNCHKMYGNDGIVCEDSELGYAILWKSHDSKYRGCKALGTIVNQQKEQSLEIKADFEKGKFRGLVKFSVVVYVKKVGEGRAPFICDLEGAVLGELSSYSFIFDGQGSIFPIVTVDEPNNPLLWTIDCSWIDPEEDSFTECVTIKFNKANKNYEKIFYGGAKFDKQLFIEVVASAMNIVVSTLRENEPGIWKEMNASDYKASDGSVCQIVKYFMNTLDMDFTNPCNSSITLRQYLGKKI